MKVGETAKTYRTKKRSYTYGDYLTLPDDGNRYEIINGELIMTPAPKTSHQRISRCIGIQLSLFTDKYNSGEIFFAPCDVVLSNKNIVQPDLLFIAKENRKIITEDNIKGAPDLIVEILSESSAYYDLITKKELYEKYGVREYWIVDPMKQWLEVYVLSGKKYQLHQRLEKRGKLKSVVLEGFELEYNKLFKK